MAEKSNSLFVDSYQMHQKLVDTILKFQEEDGICRISQPQLALLVDRSQTWVSQAIRRINTEEECTLARKCGYSCAAVRLNCRARAAIAPRYAFSCK